MIFNIYSRKGCRFCKKFVSVCRLENLDHIVYELDKDFTREEFYEQFGEGATFPQILLDDIKLGSCQESLRYMQDKNICCVI